MKQLIDRTRHPIAAGTLIAAVLIASPFAIAGTGDALREGKRNGTATKETEIIGNMKAQAGKGGFVTRQSNISSGPGAGGGAIYGCRTPVGGTSAGTAPCLRASNLVGGSAFEFASSGGPTAGLISVGNPAAPNPGAPFQTNARGLVTNLNADTVDGKHASELIGAKGDKGDPGPAGPGAKWALIKGDGTILEQSGGISIASTSPSGSYYINFGSSVANRALIVSGAYLNGDSGGRGTPIAEICGGGTDLVACVVAGTNNTNHVFVRSFNAANTANEPHAFYITAVAGS